MAWPSTRALGRGLLDFADDSLNKLAMDDESPITLAEACKLYPRARLTVSTLRAERDKGRLSIFRIGRRDYTTPRAMRDMVARCREDARPAPIRVEPADEASALASASATMDAMKKRSGSLFTPRRRHAAIREHGDHRSARSSESSSPGDQPPARDRPLVVATTSPANAVERAASRPARAPPL